MFIAMAISKQLIATIVSLKNDRVNKLSCQCADK